MRRCATIFTALVLALSGLVFSPAHAETTYDPDTGNGTVDCSVSGYFIVWSYGITGANDCSGDAVIPAGVLGIENSAFYPAPDLVSVTIPASVNTIGSSAFRDAPLLVRFTFLGNAPSSVGANAFSWLGTSPKAVVTSDATGFGIEGVNWNGLTVVVPIADGTYACGDGTYKIATVGSAVTVSEGLTCTGAVTIPEGVTEISGYAFSAAQITSVSLPASLNAIGTQPFYGTKVLTQFTVASSNAALTSLDGVLFESVGNGALLSAYPANRDASSYTTPTSVSIAGASKTVTSIKTYAFQGAQKLTTLNISEGVTTLHYGIAESATLLSTINLPDSYTVMSESAFADANALTSIEIGDLVTSIAEGVFNGSQNLSSITVDNNNAYYSSIAGVLFDKSQSKLITYPRGKTGSNYAVRDGVTHIGTGAFRNSKFTSVSIPEGVTHIESGAFLGSRVESISLPDSLIEIASQAFQSSELMTVTIPLNVSTLGKYAFNQASKLTSITVDGLNENYSSSDGVLFDKFQSKLIAYPMGNPAASYTIPSGVQTIGEDSFMFAPKLTSVVIPTDISTIESDAFTCAYYLTSFIFLGDAPAAAADTVSSSGCTFSEPKAYIKSGNATFTLLDGKWKGLTVSEFDHFVNFDSKGGSAVSLSPFVIDGNVSAPTAPTRTGYGFIGWSTTNSVSEGGTAITFPYTPGVTSDVTLFANWFRDGNYECSTGDWTDQTTDTYTISGGVVSNGSACTGDVDITEGVTSISEWAFAYSQFLESITLPASVRDIGNTAFQDSLLLENINVDIANTAFASVDGVLFNKTLTQLEAYPAGKLGASYTVPASVEIIDDRSFISSNALKTVLFEEGSQLTSLAGSVFQTSGLTSIILPAGVETIGSAFSYAHNLTSVTIPASVTDIGGYAFQWSTKLSSFYFLGEPPTVDPLTFTNIGPSPKAYLKSQNNGFTADGEGKWNGLTVFVFDHVVNYDSNDGSAVSASPFANGGNISAPTAPTRIGFTFSGWSTTDPGTAVTFPYTPGVTSDITLFANWLEDGNYFCSTGVWTEDSTDTYLVTGGVVSNGGACTGDVVIPEGVTHLGTLAFDSSSMTSISLPESLIEIGTQAFLGTGLTTMTIPNNVSTLGVGVFQAATALTSITVAANNGSYTSSSDGVLFNESLTTLIAYPLGKTAASYTIPTGVTTIGDRAFMSSQLATVVISPDVEIMEGLAFFCSTRLNSYVFLGDAPVVESSSVGCGGAAGPNALIKSGNTSFALDADGKWNGLAVKTLAPTGSYSCATGVLTTATTDIYSITDGVVSAGSACADDVVISAGVRSIEHHAFSVAQSITSVTFAGDGILTDIGEYAFEWVTELASIEIPASVSTIGYAAFFGDTALASIFFLGDDPAIDGDIFLTSQYPEKVLIAPTKAYFREGASGFTSLDGKWNGVPISPFYTLTFDATGSLSGSAPSQIISGGGENVTMPGNSGGLTKAGYTFAGWNSESDGTGDSFAVGDVGPMLAFDETLYAKWTANTYVTTYTYNSATSGNTVTSSSFTTGGTAITLPTPTRTGYTFAGWYSNIGLTTKIGNAGASYSPTGATLALRAYAKWTKNVKAKATVNPTVSGTAKVEKTLTAKNGTWTGSPTPSVTRQWYACKTAVTAAKSTVPSNCTKIPGATGTSLKLASAQKGKYVTVLVTGISAGTTKTSWLAKSTGKVK